MTWEDPVVEEIRRIRDEQAANFGYDVRKILEDAREREGKSGRTVVNLSPKRRER
jgi:hypothetical protein